MFQLTLWQSRNSNVAGRVVHHSLQSAMGRKKRSHRDGCIHLEFFQTPRPCSTGMTLVIVRPWSSLPRDPPPGPGMPWAHSSPSFLLCLLHPWPLYSALTQMTMKPSRIGTIFALMLWKEGSASQQKYFCKVKACSEPSQGTASQANSKPQKTNKIII